MNARGSECPVQAGNEPWCASATAPSSQAVVVRNVPSGARVTGQVAEQQKGGRQIFAGGRASRQQQQSTNLFNATTLKGNTGNGIKVVMVAPGGRERNGGNNVQPYWNGAWEAKPQSTNVRR